VTAKALPFSEAEFATITVFVAQYGFAPVGEDYKSGGVSYRLRGGRGEETIGFALAKLGARRWFGERTYYYIEIARPDEQKEKMFTRLRDALEYARRETRPRPG
jgi:hypothetical protein